jgi:Type II secretion system (T2SS), protein M subtype b
VRALSARERRLAAIGILIGVVVLSWQFGIAPLIDDYIQRSEDRDALTAEYERNDGILAGLLGWRKEAEEQVKTAPAFAIVAPNPQIAVELVSQRIARDVKSAGGVVQVTQPVGDKTSPEWVHVRSDLQLTMGQLYAVLMQIQSEEPYVVVGYLSVETRPNPNPNDPQSLDVRLDVFAPIRTGGATPAARTPTSHS